MSADPPASIGEMDLVRCDRTPIEFPPRSTVRAFSLQSASTSHPMDMYLSTESARMPKAAYLRLLDALETRATEMLDRVNDTPTAHPCFLDTDHARNAMRTSHTSAAASGNSSQSRSGAWHGNASIHHVEGHHGILRLLRERLMQTFRDRLDDTRKLHREVEVHGFDDSLSTMVFRRLMCLEHTDRMPNPVVDSHACVLYLGELGLQPDSVREGGSHGRPSFVHIDKTFTSLGLKAVVTSLNQLVASMQSGMDGIRALALSTHLDSRQAMTRINDAIHHIIQVVTLINRQVTRLLADVIRISPASKSLIRDIDATIQTVQNVYLSRLSLSRRAIERSGAKSVEELCDVMVCIVQRATLLMQELEPDQVPHTDRIADLAWSTQLLFDPLTLKLVSVIAAVFARTVNAWTSGGQEDGEDGDRGTDELHGDDGYTYSPRTSWPYPSSQSSPVRPSPTSPNSQHRPSSTASPRHGHEPQDYQRQFETAVWPYLEETGFVVPFVAERATGISTHGLSRVWQVLAELRQRLQLSVHASPPHGRADAFAITIDANNVHVSVPVSHAIASRLAPSMSPPPAVRAVPLLCLTRETRLRAGRYRNLGSVDTALQELIARVNANTEQTLGLVVQDTRRWIQKRESRRLPVSALPGSILENLKRMAAAGRAAMSRKSREGGHVAGDGHSGPGGRGLVTAQSLASLSSQPSQRGSDVYPQPPEQPHVLLCRILRELGRVVVGQPENGHGKSIFTTCVLTGTLSDSTPGMPGNTLAGKAGHAHGARHGSTGSADTPFIFEELDALVHDLQVPADSGVVL
ncbi:hypothetical protein BC831DRAFT_102592 [Entophlyctis helioformis]|nr:hypothetical protein BC831DRAFT_102592 [Entophlyctis helioformis]